MMKKRMVLVLMVLGMMLAACGAAGPAGPAEPTAVAVGEAGAETESPIAEPVAMDGAPLTAEAAMNVLWQWTVLRQADSPMPGVVPFAENYTIAFLPDGTAAIQADCNMVGAEYRLGEGGALSIVLGPSTMAFCGEQSSDTQYLNLLSKVVRGAIAPEGLTLATSDGETLGFVDGGMADEPAAKMDVQAMQDLVWQWTGLTETQGEVTSAMEVPTPEKYTIVFQSDGLVAVQADCNQVRGAYGLTESGIAITLGPSTKAFCGEESLDQQFLALLAAVEAAENEGDGLVLKVNGGAEMRFSSGGTAVAPGG